MESLTKRNTLWKKRLATLLVREGTRRPSSYGKGHEETALYEKRRMSGRCVRGKMSRGGERVKKTGLKFPVWAFRKVPGTGDLQSTCGWHFGSNPGRVSEGTVL